MNVWDKFWMIVMGLCVFGISVTFLNLYANTRYEDGIRQGYKTGYADSLAGQCDHSLFKTCKE